MKRFISVFLVVVLICAMVSMTVLPTEAASTGLTVSQLRQKFPQGKYWNGGNADSYTSSPCNHHDGCSYNGSCGCNSFFGLSIQCMGYAEKLGYDATGYNPRNNANGWYTYTSSSALDNLKPGDIVRYKNNGHSIYVIGVNGDTVTYTDCNNDGHCIIRWDATISKSTLRSSFSYVRSAPSSVSPGSTSCSCSTSYAGTYICTTSSLNLTIRSGHGSSYSAIGSIPPGATVTVSKASGTSSSDWAHITYNGVTGYASMQYLSKKQATQQRDSRIGLWLSNTAMGESISTIRTGEWLYLFYKLYDANTGDLLDTYNTSGGYTAKLTLYNPNGAVAHTYTYTNDNNWISIKSTTPGKYKGELVFTWNSGGTTTSTVSITMVYEPRVTPSASDIQLNVTGTNSQTISISFSGATNSSSVYLDCTTSGNCFSYKWGSWSDQKMPLTITGVREGQGTITIELYDYDTDELLATSTVYVAVQAPRYTVSYNANGGSGAPSSQTKYYNTTLTLSSTKPTRTGYAFLGWSTSSTATSASYQSGGSFTSNANTTLYAVWKEVFYGDVNNDGVVDFKDITRLNNIRLGKDEASTWEMLVGDVDGDGSITDTDFELVNAFRLNEISEFPVERMQHYLLIDTGLDRNEFLVGEEIDISGLSLELFYYDTLAAHDVTEFCDVQLPQTDTTGTKTIIITFKGLKTSYDITVVLPKYTISYNANGGTGAPTSQTKIHNAVLTLSTVKPTRSGYTFLGWSTSSSATSATYQPGDKFTDNSDTVLYAVWKKGCEGDNHTYSYAVAKKPTTSATGTLTGTCSKCSGTTTVTLPKLTTTDYTYKVTKAATCTATGTGRYTWKITTYGSFYFDVTIAKTGHSYTSKVTAPTCTAQGYTTYTCTCGDSYKDNYTTATGHSYENGICGNCGEVDPNFEPESTPDYNGLVEVNGVWGYYKDGVFQVDYTGFVLEDDIYYYVENGILDWEFYGLVYIEGYWRYVEGGQVTWQYKGLAEYNGEYFYVEQSMVKWDYTGFVLHNDSYYYIQNGHLDWSFYGLVYIDGQWRYVENGQVTWQYKGLAEYNGEYFYVEQSMVKWDYTGLVEHNGTYYYIQNGHLDWSYWGLAFVDGYWRYIENGMITWNYTGLAQMNGEYFYVIDSTLDWSYIGLIEHDGGLYYIHSGHLDWSYIGLGYHQGRWLYIYGGMYKDGYNGVVLFNNAWFYVEDSVLTWSLFGLHEFEGKLYYLNYSQIDWAYNGKAEYEGITYDVENGVADL